MTKNVIAKQRANLRLSEVRFNPLYERLMVVLTGMNGRFMLAALKRFGGDIHGDLLLTDEHVLFRLTWEQRLVGADDHSLEIALRDIRSVRVEPALLPFRKIIVLETEQTDHRFYIFFSPNKRFLTALESRIG